MVLREWKISALSVVEEDALLTAFLSSSGSAADGGKITDNRSNMDSCVLFHLSNNE